jgi:hypothetical protein
VPRAARSGGERESIIRQSRTKQALPTREKQQVLGLRFAKGNQAKGWFGWWKSRLVSADSIVFCERE